MSKIDPFGGPSENCQTNVLGRLKIVNKLSKYCPRTIILQFVDKIWTERGEAAEGRRPSFGSGRRPRPYCKIIVLGQYFDNVLMIPRLPRTFFELFPRVLRNGRFLSFWQFFDNFPATLRNPPKLSSWQFSDNFRTIMIHFWLYICYNPI